jgi:hypothetical protein
MLVGNPKQRTARPWSCERPNPSPEIDVLVPCDDHCHRVLDVGGTFGDLHVAGCCKASGVAPVLTLTPILPLHDGGKATFGPDTQVSTPTPSSESFAKGHTGQGLAQRISSDNEATVLERNRLCHMGLGKPTGRFELPANGLRNHCSTTELRRRVSRGVSRFRSPTHPGGARGRSFADPATPSQWYPGEPARP